MIENLKTQSDRNLKLKSVVNIFQAKKERMVATWAGSIPEENPNPET